MIIAGRGGRGGGGEKDKSIFLKGGKGGAGGEEAAGDGSVEEWEVIAGEAWEEVCFVCVVCVQCVCSVCVWCVRVFMCLESEH